jgi:DNA-binding transcriptional regulator/RsmH inhibitor MraZ
VAENEIAKPTAFALRQPLGNFDTRCDEKGRIRLPSNWLHFITHELKDNTVFTTSLDGQVILIYPESIWRHNLGIFEQQTEFSEDVEQILTMANHYGVESALDANGRVLIKSELRADLGLVGDIVVGTGKYGVVHMYRQADYLARIAAARQASPDATSRLRKLGMR